MVSLDTSLRPQLVFKNKWNGFPTAGALSQSEHADNKDKNILAFQAHIYTLANSFVDEVFDLAE